MLLFSIPFTFPQFSSDGNDVAPQNIPHAEVVPLNIPHAEVVPPNIPGGEVADSESDDHGYFSQTSRASDLNEEVLRYRLPSDCPLCTIWLPSLTNLCNIVMQFLK